MATELPSSTHVDRFFTRRLNDGWVGVYARLPDIAENRGKSPPMITAFNLKSEAEHYSELLNTAVLQFFNTPLKPTDTPAEVFPHGPEHR